MSDNDALYLKHDPAELPPELQPLPRVDWGDLDETTVYEILDRLPEGWLANIPGDNPTVRGVLAFGIGLRYEGEVVPTMAGLIAFGSHPEWVLPGMALQIAASGCFERDSAGSIATLHGQLLDHPMFGRLLRPAPARQLMSHALAWRSWDEEHANAPVRLELSREQLTLRLPGSPGPDVTNPVLAELLWRSGWARDRCASHAALDRAMEPVAPGGPLVTQEASGTTVRFPLPLDGTSRRTKTAPRLEARPARPQPAPEPKPVLSSPPTRSPVDPTEPLPDPGPDDHRPTEGRQDVLVRHLTEAGPMSRRDLQARLGWSRSTLRDVLRAAIDAGVVQALAPHPRSPFQVYQVHTETKQTHPSWQ